MDRRTRTRVTQAKRTLSTSDQSIENKHIGTDMLLLSIYNYNKSKIIIKINYIVTIQRIFDEFGE